MLLAWALPSFGHRLRGWSASRHAEWSSYRHFLLGAYAYPPIYNTAPPLSILRWTVPSAPASAWFDPIVTFSALRRYTRDGRAKPRSNPIIKANVRMHFNPLCPMAQSGARSQLGELFEGCHCHDDKHAWFGLPIHLFKLASPDHRNVSPLVLARVSISFRHQDLEMHL